MNILYTGASGFGESQSDSKQSLGGWISSSVISTNDNQVLPAISQSEMINGSKSYIALAINNTTEAEVTGAKIYYINKSESPLTSLKMALVIPAKDDCDHYYIESIANASSKPQSATFSQNKGEYDAITLPPIAINGLICVWIERSVIKSKGLQSISCENLVSQYEAEDSVARYTATLSGDSTWILNTPKNSYYIWYDNGSIDPTIAGSEGIRVRFDSTWTTERLVQETVIRVNDFLEDRNEVTLSSIGETISIQMLQIGAVILPDSTGAVYSTVTEGAKSVADLVEDIDLILDY